MPFDWGRILREPPQAISPIESDKRREAREAREARRRKRSRREEQERAAQAPREREPGPPGGVIPDRETDEAVDGGPEEELDRDVAADLEPEALEDEMETADRDEQGEPEGGEFQLPPSHPLLDLVGPEGFTRLRARHASLMARIAEVTDEVRREALRLAAEPLNPELWLTPAEARAALETYEAGYEALRAQLGRKRRHRRRRRGGGKKPV